MVATARLRFESAAEAEGFLQRRITYGGAGEDLAAGFLWGGDLRRVGGEKGGKRVVVGLVCGSAGPLLGCSVLEDS